MKLSQVNWGTDLDSYGNKILFQLHESICWRDSFFSQAAILCVYVYVCCLLSHVWLFVTPWTVARQAPLSMEFSRQECWSELLFPSPGDLSNPGIKHGSPALQGDSLLSEPPGKPIWQYWVGPKVCAGLSVRQYQKTQMNFGNNPVILNV